MRLLYLIRHGRTPWNLSGRNQGQTDIPLDAVGRAQARRLAERLRGAAIDALYASDLSRAAETARTLGAAIGRDPVLDEGLREIDAGLLQGLTKDEVEARFPGAYARFRETGPPGGEALDAVETRMLAALERARRAHPRGTVALVGHGFSMGLLVGRLLRVSRAERSSHAPSGNTALTLLAFEPGDDPPTVLISDCSRHVAAPRRAPGPS